MLGSWLPQLSRHLPGGGGPVLRNACLIIAMRQLLGEPTWAPREVVDLIKQHNGFPVEFNAVILEHAQVVLINEQSTAVDDETHVHFIVPGQRRIYSVPKDAPIVVCYTTWWRPGRGHAACISAHRLLRRRTVACVFLRLDTLEEPYRNDDDDDDDIHPCGDGISDLSAE